MNDRNEYPRDIVNNNDFDHKSNKRIAKNTLMLYLRQVLIILVSLYSVRVVLSTLGEIDYGIYNVVAGIVSMFGFLSGAMATASQRYFSFEIGKGDFSQLKKVFNISLTVYVLIGFLVLLLAETIGLWGVKKFLVIPRDRLSAALFVYQFSIFSFFLTIITTPFMASIIAHEYMNVYAWVSVFEAALRLCIVFVLQIIPIDKLKLYGVLLFSVSFFSTFLYRKIAKRKFLECKFELFWDSELFKELASYVGWNLFGSFAAVVRNQGINILLNISYGPIINAARAIAIQIYSAINSFAANFTLAVRPQLIKRYASNHYSEMMNLLYGASKGTFFLMYAFSLPLILEIDQFLLLWLNSEVEYSGVFTVLVLVEAMITSTSLPLMSLVQATGRIKVYQVVVGGLVLLNLPLSYISLKLGNNPTSVFIVAIIVSIVAMIMRLLIIKRIMDFCIKKYINAVVLPVLGVCIASLFIPCLFIFIIPSNFIRLILTIVLSELSIICSIFFIGLNKSERKRIVSMTKSRFGVL